MIVDMLSDEIDSVRLAAIAALEALHDKVPPYTAGHVMGRDEEPWTRHRTHVPLQRDHRACRPPRGGRYLVKGNRQPRSE